MSIGTKEQMIWVLSDLSNVNAGKFNLSEKGLQDNANQLIPFLKASNKVTDFLGNTFEVVWGPTLTNEKVTVSVPSVSDQLSDQISEEDMKVIADNVVTGYVTTNAMFVAKGKLPGSTNDAYVVAVAGTNVDSFNGWFVEDFQVGSLSAWPPAYLEIKESDQKPGKISLGTYSGLQNLWTKPDPTKGTIYDFLNETIKATDTADIAVCGHSLGGALSPTLAVALAEKGFKGKVTVSAHPTAGPTPGDSDFANHVIKTLGVDNYVSRVNSHDIVPHAWQEDGDMGMKNLDKIYNISAMPYLNSGSKEGIPNTPIIRGFAFWAKAQRKGNSYKRIGTDEQFNGTLLSVDKSKLIKKILNPIYHDENEPVSKKAENKKIRKAFYAINVGMTGDVFASKEKMESMAADFLAFAIEAGNQHTQVYATDGFALPTDVISELNTLIDMRHLSPEAEAEVFKIVAELVKRVATYVFIYGPKGS